MARLGRSQPIQTQIRQQRAVAVTINGTASVIGVGAVANTNTIVQATSSVVGAGAITAVGGSPEVHLFSGTPSIADVVDENELTLGTEFYTTKTAWVTKVRYLQHTGATGGTLAQRQMAIWSVDGLGNGTLVSALVTMPTPTYGQWCEQTLPTPVMLEANKHYRVGVFHPHDSRYVATAHYFDGEFTTQTIGGYLVLPKQTDAINSVQGSYQYASTPTFPYNEYNATNYWVDVSVTDVAPGSSGGTGGPVTLTKLAQYQGSSAGTSFNIPLSPSSTAGKELFIVGHAAAVMTLPSPWVKTRIFLGATELAYWRLSPANHTASLSSVTMTMAASRRPAVVVIQTESIDSTPYFLVGNNTPTSGGTVWSTGNHLISRKAMLAIYTAEAIGPLYGVIESYDQGFTAFADTGDPGSNSSSDEGIRIWLASKLDATLNGQQVLASAPTTPLSDWAPPGTASGIIGWDGVATGIIDGIASVSGAGAVTASAAQSVGVSVVGVGATSAKATVVVGSPVIGAGTTTALVVQRASTTTTGAGSTTGAVTQFSSAAVAGVGTTSTQSTQNGASGVVGAGTVTALAIQRVSSAVNGSGSISATGTEIINLAGTSSTAGVGSVTAKAVVLSASSVIGAGTVNVPIGIQSSLSPVVGAGAVNSPLVRQVTPATLVGAGSINANGLITGTASVTGTGSTSALYVQRVPSAVTGTGTTTANGYITGSASVTGAGSISALSTQIVSTTALNGTGAITTTSVAIPSTVAIAGIGSVNANSGGSASGFATVSGAGSITANAVIAATSAITGAGSVNTPLNVQRSTTSVSGAGSGTSLSSQSAVSSVAGVGAVVANASGATSGTATVAGAGTVTALVKVLATTSTSGAGAVTVPSVIQGSTSTVAGLGTTTSVVVQNGTVSLSGSGSITANASGAINGTATVMGVGTVVANPSGTSAGSATVAGTGAVTAVVRVISTGTSVAGTGAVSAYAMVITAPITIAGQGSISASGIRAANADAVLTVIALITSGGVLSKSSTAILSATATTAQQAGLTRVTGAALTAIANLTTTGGRFGAEYAYVLVGHPILDAQAVAHIDVPEYSYVY